MVHASSVSSRVRPPALLTRMCSRPKRATVSATSRSMSSARAPQVTMETLSWRPSSMGAGLRLLPQPALVLVSNGHRLGPPGADAVPFEQVLGALGVAVRGRTPAAQEADVGRAADAGVFHRLAQVVRLAVPAGALEAVPLHQDNDVLRVFRVLE